MVKALGFFLLGHMAILLSLRLVGAVGGRINARSSYSQWVPAVTWLRTQVLTVASPALYWATPLSVATVRSLVRIQAMLGHHGEHEVLTFILAATAPTNLKSPSPNGDFATS